MMVRNSLGESTFYFIQCLSYFIPFTSSFFVQVTLAFPLFLTDKSHTLPTHTHTIHKQGPMH